MTVDVGALICIAGASGAGKSVLAKRLADKFALSHTAFSDLLRNDALAMGLDPTVSNLQYLGQRRIAAGWPAFVADLTALLGWPPARPAVIEGIRHLEAIVHCESIADGLPVLVIYLDIERDLRERRIAARGRDRDSLIDVESHSVESHIREVESRADLVLGEGTVDEWLAKIESALV